MITYIWYRHIGYIQFIMCMWESWATREHNFSLQLWIFPILFPHSFRQFCESLLRVASVLYCKLIFTIFHSYQFKECHKFNLMRNIGRIYSLFIAWHKETNQNALFMAGESPPNELLKRLPQLIVSAEKANYNHVCFHARSRFVVIKTAAIGGEARTAPHFNGTPLSWHLFIEWICKVHEGNDQVSGPVIKQ